MKRIQKYSEKLGTLLDFANGSVSPQDIVDVINKILALDPKAKIVVQKDGYGYLSQNSSITLDYALEHECSAVFAGELSKRHRDRITDVTPCGCYICFRLFMGAEIVEWTDNGQTAKCPRCNTNSVIPNIDDAKFLIEAGEKWFTGKVEKN